MKRTLAVAAAVAAALVPATPALARGGGWQPVPAEPFDAVTCGANLRFEPVVNTEFYRIVTIHGQETLQITGHFTAAITNTDTGDSVEENVSGPAFNSLDGLAYSSRGRSLFLFPPDQATANGVPELFVNAGHMDLVVDDAGTITVVKTTGHVTDLCAELT